MTVRMTFPSFVTRAATRIAVGGLVAAAAIAVAALVIERTALGGDLAASRARLRAEVEGEFAALTARLDQAVRAVTLDPDTLRRAERGDASATRAAVRSGRGQRRRTDVAVTIYGATNQPVAWLGRSEDVPDARLSGPASRSSRRAARACSWSASSRSSIQRSRRGISARSSPRRRCPATGRRHCPARSSRSKPASCRSRCGCSSKARRMPVPMRSSSARRPNEAARGGDRVGRGSACGAAAHSRSPVCRRAHAGGAARAVARGAAARLAPADAIDGAPRRS